MATRTLCDCGCGKELAEYDAGRIPVIIRNEKGVTVEMRVHPMPGGTVPHIRPSCLRKVIGEGEQLFPCLPKVVDAAVAGPEEDAASEVEAHDDVRPLRAAGGEA